MSICYINGEYLQAKESKIPILDLGFIRGYGVFDYLRTYQRKPFHIKDHLLRFRYSAQEIGLQLPFTLEKMEEIITTLIEKNPYAECSLKLIVTGGVSEDQITPNEIGTLFILVQPAKDFPPSFYQDGIKVTTTQLSRSLPKSKTLHYTQAIIALKKSKLHGAQEALYLSSQGDILEATTSNFFAFDQKGALITPPAEDILVGITRSVVLKLAQDHFPIEIRTISSQEIKEFSEAFITSSNRGVMPVIQIDDQPIGEKKVGPKTEVLMKLFQAYTRQGDWDFLKIDRYL